ncbi:ABC transporter [Anopheles sinensis]|uniref:ABC transporter n=1 Tax=Anopheles sinensis TaxID=74873 RepID=A0A084WE20_ANOSI|nr:ABC transporter [Anopheles sinensis]
MRSSDLHDTVHRKYTRGTNPGVTKGSRIYTCCNRMSRVLFLRNSILDSIWPSGRPTLAQEDGFASRKHYATRARVTNPSSFHPGRVSADNLGITYKYLPGHPRGHKPGFHPPPNIARSQTPASDLEGFTPATFLTKNTSVDFAD